MRIRTDGDKAYRLDAIQDAMDALDENTKTAAIITACEHAQRDRAAKERALAHPDMTAELAEVLSTPAMQLRYEVSTDIETEWVNPRDTKEGAAKSNLRPNFPVDSGYNVSISLEIWESSRPI